MTNLMRGLAITGAAVAAIGLLWVLFAHVPVWLGGADLDRLVPKERLDAVATIRGQIATVLGSALVAAGLHYTGRKFALDRDKQFTDRLNAAVNHLGATDITVRAGGIRALGRMLQDSPADRDLLLHTLTGYLRQHTGGDGPCPDPAREDINAATAILRRRRPRSRITEQSLDLRRVRLAGADLRGIQLPGADLTRADLTHATLTDADLADARLDTAVLTRAAATGVRLRSASLRQAELCGTDLARADCSGADLTGANLSGAALTGTDLTGTVLDNADLRDTDLSRAVGLAGPQLRLARFDRRTRVPPGIDHPDT